MSVAHAYGGIAISTWVDIPGEIGEKIVNYPKVSIELLLPEEHDEAHHLVKQRLGSIPGIGVLWEDKAMCSYFLAYDENSMVAGIRQSLEMMRKSDAIQLELSLGEQNVRSVIPELQYYEPKSWLYSQQDNIDSEALLLAYQDKIVSGRKKANYQLKRLDKKVHAQHALPANQPTMRHVYYIKDFGQLDPILNAILSFEKYRPHETHYVIQGLVCATYILRALTPPGSKDNIVLRSIMSYYPRRWFSPKYIRNSYPIDQVNVDFFGWPVMRQYQQLAFWFHKSLQNMIRQQINPVSPQYRDRRLLGSGVLVTSNLLFGYINGELMQEDKLDLEKFYRFLKGRIFSLPKGYLLLPLILREFPEEEGLELLKVIMGEKKSLQSYPLLRLYQDLYHFRICALPIELLATLYDQYAQPGNLPILQAKGIQKTLCHILYPFSKIVSPYGSDKWQSLVLKNAVKLNEQPITSVSFRGNESMKVHLPGQGPKTFFHGLNRWFREGGD